jgi:probable addiction module antidote protein
MNCGGQSTRGRSHPHEAWLRRQLRDPAFAADYLTAAAEDDPAVYMAALRQIAEAHGMAKVAEAAGVPCESLYRALVSWGQILQPRIKMPDCKI